MHLKDLKLRKQSIMATRKITSAMKMIAAAKLKRAQGALEAARPYAKHMSHILQNSIQAKALNTIDLLHGRAQPTVHLFVVITSNRGLCGNFNGIVVRTAKRLMEKEKAKGHAIKLICWGDKGREQLKKEYGSCIIDSFSCAIPHFDDADQLSRHIQHLFSQGVFDTVRVIYNHFISALHQDIRVHSLIPFSPEKTDSEKMEDETPYEYEPSQEDVLRALLPKNISVQLFKMILESMASEQGARMTAMDAATRSAEDMTRKLDLEYNRTRQALITKELIEIISGADAL